MERSPLPAGRAAAPSANPAPATNGCLGKPVTYCPCPTAMSYSHCPHSPSQLALQNPKLIYDLLFRAVRETFLTIAADPKRLGSPHRFPRRAAYLESENAAPPAPALSGSSRRIVPWTAHAGSPAASGSFCPRLFLRAGSESDSRNCSRPATAASSSSLPASFRLYDGRKLSTGSTTV